jgi:hypothetical protein
MGYVARFCFKTQTKNVIWKTKFNAASSYPFSDRFQGLFSVCLWSKCTVSCPDQGWLNLYYIFTFKAHLNEGASWSKCDVFGPVPSQSPRTPLHHHHCLSYLGSKLGFGLGRPPVHNLWLRLVSLKFFKPCSIWIHQVVMQLQTYF